jgi:hypothetical protein
MQHLTAVHSEYPIVTWTPARKYCVIHTPHLCALATELISAMHSSQNVCCWIDRIDVKSGRSRTSQLHFALCCMAQTAIQLSTGPAGAAVLCRLHSILAAQQAAGVTMILATSNPAAFSSITRTVYSIEEGTLCLQGK